MATILQKAFVKYIFLNGNLYEILIKFVKGSNWQ